MKKAPKILYFIAGSVPTEDDVTAAEELGANVVFRNAEFIDQDAASLEPCDGVAGSDIYEKKKIVDEKTGKVSYEETDKVIGSNLPKSYAAAYPDAEDVLKAYKAGKDLPKVAPKAAAKPAAGAPGWQAGK